MLEKKEIELNKLISLAIDIWRLEEKINNSTISEEEREKLNITIFRLKKFVQEQGIEIKGYDLEKYSEEINVYELKWIEETNDEKLKWKIKDTIEPATFLNWNLIKPAKIIAYKYNENLKTKKKTSNDKWKIILLITAILLVIIDILLFCFPSIF